jgi:hypothetical protein
MELQDIPAIKRAKQLQGIDDLLEVWFPKARASDRFAVDKVIRLWERQSRLLGIDAPTVTKIETDKLMDMSLDDLLEEAKKRGIPMFNYE